MKFTKNHEWIDLEGDIATIGITDHAQKELGEITYVELPKPGPIIQEGEEIVVLESTKAAVDIYSPLKGKLVEVNTSLLQEPHKINQSPESEGWLFKLHLSDKTRLATLMDKAAYLAFLST